MKTFLILILSFNIFGAEVPHSFSSGEKIEASKINENFSSLKPEIVYVQERIEGTGSYTISKGVTNIDINHVQGNSSRVSFNLVNNEIIIAPGKYDIKFDVSLPSSGGAAGNSSCYLYNATDSTGEVLNTSISHVHGLNIICSGMGIIENSSGSTKVYQLRRDMEGTGTDNLDHIQTDIFSYDIFANLRIQTIE